MLISEYDQLEQSQQPFRVDELLQAVARPHQRAIAIKKLHMEINNSVDENRCFLGSLQAMVQAINPILENAVKFTEVGNITLEAGMIDDDSLQFAISDSGRGMDSLQKQQLEDLFSADETNHGQPYQSLGLGTAITKRLVEALHGEIRFDSSLHKGSVFYLRFPVTPSRCPEKSIPLDFNSTLPNYKAFPPIIPGHTIPESLLNRFTEALAESSIDQQAQREIVHWARKGGHQQWADSFQNAIDENDLNSASQLIRQMILLQQSDQSTIDKNIA
jgi:anti-sigma regulatory factor (Ser/Thr protein kinase)